MSPVSCPNCASTSVQAVPTASRNPLGTAAREAAFGTAAALTTQTQALRVGCLACGATWTPERPQDWRLASLTDAEADRSRKLGVSQSEFANRKRQLEQWRRENPMLAQLSWMLPIVVILVVIFGVFAALGGLFS